MCPVSIAFMNKLLKEAVDNQWGRRSVHDCQWPAKQICANCAVWKRDADGYQYLKRLHMAFRFQGCTEVRVEGAVRMSEWSALNPWEPRDADLNEPPANDEPQENMANEIRAEL